MRVGELARRTGVGVSTLRAWETRFRFLEPQRSPAGHRLYEEADVDRVEAVHRLVAEGLTLAAAIARVGNVGPAALPAGEAEALLYNQILEAAGQGIWVIRDGRTRFANRRMAEMMGHSVEELAALPILGVFPPEELPLVAERTARARNGHRLHFTQELRRADGSTFLAEVNTTPLINQAGRYEGAVALVSDITERNRTETEEHLRATLLDSIGEAVTAATPDGTVLYVNAAAERLFGWRAADVIGRQDRDVFPSPDAPEHANRIRASLVKGKAFSGRHRMLRRDRSEFVGQLTAAPVLDDQGVVVGLVGIISDQTERDRMERDQQSRERQAETVALLGAQALRERAEPNGGATLILAEALEATRRLLRADRVTVLDVIVDADELRVRVACPELDEAITVRSGSRSFSGYIALARKVVIVDNAELDQRFDAHGNSTASPASSAIGAPIFGPNGICAVLVAQCATPSTFVPGDAHFIQGMANIIGTALLP
ncbi:MAG: hypothetical protein QOI95_742 [Acidimicrobiaceae bacterium]